MEIREALGSRHNAAGMQAPAHGLDRSMTSAIYVRAVGLSDREADTFAAVLERSPPRLYTYRFWRADCGREADIYLLDGSQPAHAAEVARIASGVMAPFLWVGPNAPSHAAHAFQRPLAWNSILDTLEVVASGIEFGLHPSSAGLVVEEGVVGLDMSFADFGLDSPSPSPLSSPPSPSSPGTTAPSSSSALPAAPLGLQPFDPSSSAGARAAALPQRRDRVLVVGASVYETLFLRRRLALQGIHDVVEVLTVQEALARAQMSRFDHAIVDLDALGRDGWDLHAPLRQGAYPVRQVILMTSRATALQLAKARLVGITLLQSKPIDTRRLDQLLAPVPSRGPTRH